MIGRRTESRPLCHLLGPQIVITRVSGSTNIRAWGWFPRTAPCRETEHALPMVNKDSYTAVRQLREHEAELLEVKGMDQIMMKPIGVIHSPYTEVKDMPIQGVFKPDVKAWVELEGEYAIGLKDLGKFSHAILIYYFHKSHQEHVVASPFLEDEQHGIFAIRSPHRPNHIGLSVVRIDGIDKNRLYFREVDVLDGTPLLDIKPYVRYFDVRTDVVSGWLDKHFLAGDIPDQTIIE